MGGWVQFYAVLCIFFYNIDNVFIAFSECIYNIPDYRQLLSSFSECIYNTFLLQFQHKKFGTVLKKISTFYYFPSTKKICFLYEINFHSFYGRYNMIFKTHLMMCSLISLKIFAIYSEAERKISIRKISFFVVKEINKESKQQFLWIGICLPRFVHNRISSFHVVILDSMEYWLVNKG